jgi:hypothetical protein
VVIADATLTPMLGTINAVSAALQRLTARSEYRASYAIRIFQCFFRVLQIVAVRAICPRTEWRTP